jgi:hypothetical protein
MKRLRGIVRWPSLVGAIALDSPTQNAVGVDDERGTTVALVSRECFLRRFLARVTRCARRKIDLLSAIADSD